MEDALVVHVRQRGAELPERWLQHLGVRRELGHCWGRAGTAPGVTLRKPPAAGRLGTLPFRMLMREVIAYFTERQPPLEYYDGVYADLRTGGLTVETGRPSCVSILRRA